MIYCNSIDHFRKQISNNGAPRFDVFFFILVPSYIELPWLLISLLLKFWHCSCKLECKQGDWYKCFSKNFYYCEIYYIKKRTLNAEDIAWWKCCTYKILRDISLRNFLFFIFMRLFMCATFLSIFFLRSFFRSL